jgi:GntR family transcriptional regulator
MIQVTLNSRARIPVYKQIVEQIKQQVAGNQLKAGEKLPTVRELAQTLGINPATVARAYQELEQENILGASRRRGTLVLGDSGNPLGETLRQSRLNSTINALLVESLSQGYSPEEIETAFSGQLASWRKQREMVEITPNPGFST